VEDEPEIAEILTDILSRVGYRVMSTGKQTIAQEMLVNQKFGCVTVDIRLAQGSGENVITQMRSDRKGFNHDTPVLVISSHLTQDLVQKIGGKIQGALSKPFQNEELVAKITKLCPI
jgi:two-component system alkaline phosphatase synthesis response regulator PhoP